MRKTVIYSMMVITLLWSCTSQQKKMENDMKKFISGYEDEIIPLYKEANLAYWDANVNGTAEAWARNEKASVAYISYYTNNDACDELKGF